MTSFFNLYAFIYVYMFIGGYVYMYILISSLPPINHPSLSTLRSKGLSV